MESAANAERANRKHWESHWKQPSIGEHGKCRPAPQRSEGNGRYCSGDGAISFEKKFQKEKDWKKAEAVPEGPSAGRGILMEKKRAQEIPPRKCGEQMRMKIDTGHLFEITVQEVHWSDLKILIFRKV